MVPTATPYASRGGFLFQRHSPLLRIRFAQGTAGLTALGDLTNARAANEVGRAGGVYPRAGRSSVSASGTPSDSSFARSISAFTSAPNSRATFVSHSQNRRMIAAANEP